jgi:hypothetical protein
MATDPTAMVAHGVVNDVHPADLRPQVVQSRMKSINNIDHLLLHHQIVRHRLRLKNVLGIPISSIVHSRSQDHNSRIVEAAAFQPKSITTARLLLHIEKTTTTVLKKRDRIPLIAATTIGMSDLRVEKTP